MEKFVLELNIDDKLLLNEIAKEKGFETDRELINNLITSFPSDIDITKMKCVQKERKFKNNYDIPKEHEDFYAKLACVHSTTTSAIIFRYLLLPLLIEKKTQCLKLKTD